MREIKEKEKILQLLARYNDYILGGDINEEIAEALLSMDIYKMAQSREVASLKKQLEWCQEQRQIEADKEEKIMADFNKRLIEAYKEILDLKQQIKILSSH